MTFYGYGPVRGPITIEGAQAGKDAVARGECPACGRPLRDLRAKLYNALAIEKEGVCFLWADDAYTCVTKEKK